MGQTSNLLILLAVVLSSARDNWQHQRALADTLGSTSASYPIIADPAMPHVKSACGNVTLFAMNFTTYATESFEWAPLPCMRRAATRILISVFCNVSAGRQFDRSLYIALGGATVFAGTTSEPGKQASPSWRVSADITEYFSLLESGGNGTVRLDTIVNQKYNGVPFCTANILLFSQPGPTPPDIVIPLGSNTNVLSKRFPALPKTASAAYISYQAQGQQDDEFWWSCVPSRFADLLKNCPGTSYRHLNISTSKSTVALVPVQPYVFSGGVDPFLWIPTPAPQMLHLLSQRISLPVGHFAPDADEHEITLSVGPLENVNSFWQLSGSLFVFLDPAVETRGIESHTEPSAAFTVTTDIDNRTISGKISVNASTFSETVGFVTYRNGTKQDSSFRSELSFGNVQFYQDEGSQVLVIQECDYRHFDNNVIQRRNYPLLSNTSTLVAANNSNQTIQRTVMKLGYESNHFDEGRNFSSAISNWVNASDVLILTKQADGSYTISGGKPQQSKQVYAYADSAANCYHATVEAVNGTLTGHTIECNQLADWVDPYIGETAPPKN